VLAVRPGSRIPDDVRASLLTTYASDASARVEVSQQQQFGIQTLVNVVTNNPLKSAVDMDMIGLIFFGIMFGAALTLIPMARARPMLDVLEALQDVVIKIVEMAMRLAPYGVAALIFGVTSRFGFDVLRLLGWYVAVVLGSLVLHLAINISGIVRFLIGMSPVLFFQRIRTALVTAFSTSSSSATLPTALATAEENLGIPKQIAGFVMPLGSTMCMHGTALFEGITVITLAQAFGVSSGRVYPPAGRGSRDVRHSRGGDRDSAGRRSDTRHGQDGSQRVRRFQRCRVDRENRRCMDTGDGARSGGDSRGVA
jgi:DAACS family dicarboxylate/amino acid:cation (Na+ or H+) symporter